MLTVFIPITLFEFAKLHMGLVVLVKKMSVLINFLLQNTNLVSVLSKICPNLLVMSDRTDTFRKLYTLSVAVLVFPSLPHFGIILIYS